MRHLRTYSYDVGSDPLPNLFSLPLGRVNESQLIVRYHCLVSPVKLSLFEKARQQEIVGLGTLWRPRDKIMTKFSHD